MVDINGRQKRRSHKLTAEPRITKLSPVFETLQFSTIFIAIFIYYCVII